jgi:hypothetical protein
MNSHSDNKPRKIRTVYPGHTCPMYSVPSGFLMNTSLPKESVPNFERISRSEEGVQLGPLAVRVVLRVSHN